MPPKRKIKAAEIVERMRAGVTDAELMAQYRLSVQGLREIFNRLVDAKVIKPEELENRSASGSTVEAETEIRRHARIRMDLPIRVYQIEYSTIKAEGRVRDISEKGLGVRGIETGKGEVKTYLAVADANLHGDPIVFQAECRWVKREGPEREPIVGLQITHIPEASANGLQRLVEKLKSMLDY